MIDITSHQLIYAPHLALDTAVKKFSGDADLRQLISEHMQSLCRHHKGLGLAANQIEMDAAVFVTYVHDNMVTMFNPEIMELSNDKVLLEEGCLSDPGLFLKINRPAVMLASWESETGERCEATLTGMECRTFLHELDHLNGIMFSDRAGVTKLTMARKRQAKLMQRATNRIIAAMK